MLHAIALARRSKQRIYGLYNEVGQWIIGEEKIANMIFSFYRSLFKSDKEVAEMTGLPELGGRKLSEEDSSQLECPPNSVDIWRALKNIGRDKAPGVDGFNAGFYQGCWEVVGDSVVELIHKFWRIREVDAEANQTLLVFVLKKVGVNMLKKFYPISLYTTLYKILTKILVGRLRRMLNELICLAQASFIPGRCAVDNVMLMQELLSRSRKTKGEKRFEVSENCLRKGI